MFALRNKRLKQGFVIGAAQIKRVAFWQNLCISSNYFATFFNCSCICFNRCCLTESIRRGISVIRCNLQRLSISIWILAISALEIESIACRVLGSIGLLLLKQDANEQ
jgi:hypothetical protein